MIKNKHIEFLTYGILSALTASMFIASQITTLPALMAAPSSIFMLFSITMLLLTSMLMATFFKSAQQNKLRALITAITASALLITGLILYTAQSLTTLPTWLSFINPSALIALAIITIPTIITAIIYHMRANPPSHSSTEAATAQQEAQALAVEAEKLEARVTELEAAAADKDTAHERALAEAQTLVATVQQEAHAIAAAAQQQALLLAAKGEESREAIVKAQAEAQAIAAAAQQNVQELEASVAELQAAAVTKDEEHEQAFAQAQAEAQAIAATAQQKVEKLEERITELEATVAAKDAGHRQELATTQKVLATAQQEAEALLAKLQTSNQELDIAQKALRTGDKLQLQEGQLKATHADQKKIAELTTENERLELALSAARIAGEVQGGGGGAPAFGPASVTMQTEGGGGGGARPASELAFTACITDYQKEWLEYLAEKTDVTSEKLGKEIKCMSQVLFAPSFVDAKITALDQSKASTQGWIGAFAMFWAKQKEGIKGAINTHFPHKADGPDIAGIGGGFFSTYTSNFSELEALPFSANGIFGEIKANMIRQNILDKALQSKRVTQQVMISSLALTT